MKSVFVVTHPDCMLHRPGIGHPESPERLRTLLGALPAGLEILTCSPAPPEDPALVHDENYVAYIRDLSAAGKVTRTDPDTVLSPGTWQSALCAAGAMRAAVEMVMDGRAQRVFCAVRPPGHHAERSNTKGFCFFNTIAIGARILQQEYGMRRIAIIDWDAHHGNGTQDAFYSEAGVYYVSLHQYPLFPGTGRRCQRGNAAGKGANLNIPLAPGATDRDICDAFCEEVVPAITDYQPEILLVSAGFDGHISEPLAGWQLTAQAYACMTRRVVDLAQRFSKGRIISLLEGGYNRRALIDCVSEHLRELRGSLPTALRAAANSDVNSS